MPSSWDPRDVRHPQRQSWDEYFLDLARAAATRSTCSRRRAGAVLVNERHTLSTGFNGTPSGHPHCDEEGCSAPDEPDTGLPPCTAVEAEANALLFAAPRDREGATLYTTHMFGLETAKLVANSGIAEVVVAGPAERTDVADVRAFLLRSGVRIRVLEPSDGPVTVGAP